MLAPNSTFTLVKKPVFDPKTDDLDFAFSFSNAGTFTWSLSFKNADVGFADSLGISLGQGALPGETGAVAEAAKHKGKGAKAKKCKKGEVKHHGKCKRTLVPFASGSQSVPAGTVEVKVHADPQAIKALNGGHPLHVSGTFTFQSSLGGASYTLSESTVVHRPKKKKGKKHGRK